MTEKKSCNCSIRPNVLIFACSGASNVGQITNGVAVKAAREKVGQMSCLAGVGAHLDDFVTLSQTCRTLVAIDGCDKQCAKKVFDHLDISPVLHMDLSTLGFEKKQGASATEADIENAFDILKNNLKQQRASAK
ncbi:MAG: putative zinc-binding protein [Deltaproteobacteria bacterium]|nr:putative zinc-binding protein [Deltaproteobacteria bacterium]